MAASVAGPERRNKMNKYNSPSDLSGDAEYFTVDGVPVAVDDLDAIRFDTKPPSPFDITSVMSNGVEIDRAAFMALLPS